MELNRESLGRKIKGYYPYGRPQQISILEKLWFILHVENLGDEISCSTGHT
jgi:hypothetical protein